MEKPRFCSWAIPLGFWKPAERCNRERFYQWREGSFKENLGLALPGVKKSICREDSRRAMEFRLEKFGSSSRGGCSSIGWGLSRENLQGEKIWLGILPGVIFSLASLCGS
jgi:hypothetical protein